MPFLHNNAHQSSVCGRVLHHPLWNNLACCVSFSSPLPCSVLFSFLLFSTVKKIVMSPKRKTHGHTDTIIRQLRPQNRPRALTPISKPTQETNTHETNQTHITHMVEEGCEQKRKGGCHRQRIGTVLLHVSRPIKCHTSRNLGSA